MSKTLCLYTLATALVCCTLQVESQTRDLELGLGITGGVTKYYGDFTNDPFGPAAEMALTFTPIRPLTLGLGVTLGQIKWRVTPSALASLPQYFGQGASYGDLYPGTYATIEEFNQSRVSIYEFTSVWNILPNQDIVPFIGVGVGIVDFSPTNRRQHESLPNNSAGKYDKWTWAFPLIAGFNLYITDDLSFTAKGSYRFTMTEWLDDYKSAAGTDQIAMLQGGLTYHFTGDRDPDGDGVPTRREREFGTNPFKADTDGDGLTDGDEIMLHKTDPLRRDTDGDGLTDGEEVLELNTNPLLADTDGDGLPDGVEVITYRTNPTNVDTDNDRLFDGEEVLRYKTDPLKKDTDGDGIEDADELSCRYQTNPLNPDTDGDGLIDSKDPEPSIRCEGCGGGGGIPPYANPAPMPQPAPELKPTTSPIPEPKVETPPPAPLPTPNKRRSFQKDIRFKVNTDEFDFDFPETEKNLRELLSYLEESCDELQVMIEGHASADGPPQRNKDLSNLRAHKVRQWLLQQGISPNKIRGAVGYGSAMPRVKEPTPAQMKSMTKEQQESIRAQNRRIEMAVLKDCGEANG
ncbi:MAG: OmpA family protein [Ignavibacteria bacterium]|nr:OmpA family protein [Ignavibacteria bacterium]